MHLAALLDFQFIVLFFIWAFCLLPIFDGYVVRPRSDAGNNERVRSYAWSGQSIALFIVGILAFIAWLFLLVKQVF